MLANEKVRLNDTVGRNNHLKNEINIMRKEILYTNSFISYFIGLLKIVLPKWTGPFAKSKEMQHQLIKITSQEVNKEMRQIIKF